MVLNLKAVYSGSRLGIASRYTQLRTARAILGCIHYLTLQPLHGLYAWRYRGMEKHWNREIALRNHVPMEFAIRPAILDNLPSLSFLFFRNF